MHNIQTYLAGFQSLVYLLICYHIKVSFAMTIPQSKTRDFDLLCVRNAYGMAGLVSN